MNFAYHFIRGNLNLILGAVWATNFAADLPWYSLVSLLVIAVVVDLNSYDMGVTRGMVIMRDRAMIFAFERAADEFKRSAREERE